MTASRPTLILLDNGSLEPAATLSLRRIAGRLSKELGEKVHPMSLLHSHKIPGEQLDGIPAETFERGIKPRLAAGETNFLIIPLFFGPSAALTEYVPNRVSVLKRDHPELCVRVAPCLVDPTDSNDERMAAILEDNILSALASHHSQVEVHGVTDPTSALRSPISGLGHPTSGLRPPPAIILVDHGSPKREVNAIREHLTGQLRRRLGDRVNHLNPASMERRPEAEYDFNEPLLERAFEQLPSKEGPVIVSMLFLSPGRHAGPGGDIACICKEARARHPGLNPILTPLVGEHEGLIPILADRARAAIAG